MLSMTQLMKIIKPADDRKNPNKHQRKRTPVIQRPAILIRPAQNRRMRMIIASEASQKVAKRNLVIVRIPLQSQTKVKLVLAMRIAMVGGIRNARNVVPNSSNNDSDSVQMNQGECLLHFLHIFISLVVVECVWCR